MNAERRKAEAMCHTPGTATQETISFYLFVLPREPFTLPTAGTQPGPMALYSASTASTWLRSHVRAQPCICMCVKPRIYACTQSLMYDRGYQLVWKNDAGLEKNRTPIGIWWSECGLQVDCLHQNHNCDSLRFLEIKMHSLVHQSANPKRSVTSELLSGKWADTC